MPGITLQLSGREDVALATRLATALTTLTCEVLEKRPEQTMVLVRFVPPELWFIEGRSLIGHGRNSFRLEVTITDETNTREQKAYYQRAAFDLVAGIIGNLHPQSNIHIIDCRATAYGYGGISQEQRRYLPQTL